MAGATSLLGASWASGSSLVIHKAHLLGLSDDLPEKIRDRRQAREEIRSAAAGPRGDDGGGLVVVEDVHVVRYLHEPKVRTKNQTILLTPLAPHLMY